uniref:Mobile element protein n=1 Tax=Parastrongyloides trichosuri TaxID=131310 RepID=A0A0N4ZTW4_PARTI
DRGADWRRRPSSCATGDPAPGRTDAHSSDSIPVPRRGSPSLTNEVTTLRVAPLPYRPRRLPDKTEMTANTDAAAQTLTPAGDQGRHPRRPHEEPVPEGRQGPAVADLGGPGHDPAVGDAGRASRLGHGAGPDQRPGAPRHLRAGPAPVGGGCRQLPSLDQHRDHRARSGQLPRGPGAAGPRPDRGGLWRPGLSGGGRPFQGLGPMPTFDPLRTFKRRPLAAHGPAIVSFSPCGRRWAPSGARMRGVNAAVARFRHKPA